jgi:hypothetical protein
MQLRNEAYETHYLNTFKILSVDHKFDEHIFPTESNNIIDWRKELIKVGSFISIESVRDRYGKDISKLIQNEDGIYHSTSSNTLENIADSDYQMDWIELEMEIPEDQDKFFLALKMRSTLLNTVLLYDLFLADQNFGAIDWISNKTNSIIYAYQFAKWYRKNFGMHIEVWEDGAYQEVRQIGDSGPITWSKLAFEIPVKTGGRKKIRLKYIADNWHIDWLGISLQGSKDVAFEVHDIDRVSSNALNTNVFERLSSDDEDYLVTYPGHSYEFDFKIAEAPAGMRKSLFIQSKGFYIEWLRKDWLLPEGKEPFKKNLDLNDSLIVSLYREWDCQKATMEDYFFETMVSVTTQQAE